MDIPVDMFLWIAIICLHLEIGMMIVECSAYQVPTMISSQRLHLKVSVNNEITIIKKLKGENNPVSSLL
jgi:hypothetical protein